MTTLQIQLDIALFGAPEDVQQASNSFLRCQIDTSLDPTGRDRFALQVDTLPHLTPALAHMGEVVRVSNLRVHRLPPAPGERLFEADLASWTQTFPHVAFVLMGRRLDVSTQTEPVCFLEVALPPCLAVPVSECSVAGITANAWKLIAPSWLIHWRTACLHEDTRDHAFEALLARLPCRKHLEAFSRQQQLDRCWAPVLVEENVRGRL